MSSFPPPECPPLVDLAVLHELERQVDGRSAVLGFVRDFADLWEARYGRLAEALAAQDPDTALDVLLSLKAAAAMAGAVRLSGAAERIEEAVKCGEPGTAAEFLPLLASCGRETLQALRERYVTPTETD